MERLRRYLTGRTRTEKLEPVADTTAFINHWIDALLKEAGNAETPGQ
jgi:hypothetical protein